MGKNLYATKIIAHKAIFKGGNDIVQTFIASFKSYCEMCKLIFYQLLKMVYLILISRFWKIKFLEIPGKNAHPFIFRIFFYFPSCLVQVLKISFIIQEKNAGLIKYTWQLLWYQSVWIMWRAFLLQDVCKTSEHHPPAVKAVTKPMFSAQFSGRSIKINNCNPFLTSRPKTRLS